jgi:hypothetical protein
MTSVVYAGTINEYEQELITMAKGVYEYNGVDYQVDPAYIKELIGYLNSEDVDLTAEQRDKAEQKAFSSVAQGVEEGYLIPVKKEILEEESEKDTITDSGVNSTITSNQEGETDIGVPKNTDVFEDSSSNKVLNKQSENEIANNVETTISPELMQGSKLEETDIIKNTGFDLSNTIFMVIGMGVLMVLGIYVTFQYNLFAPNDEP